MYLPKQTKKNHFDCNRVNNFHTKYKYNTHNQTKKKRQKKWNTQYLKTKRKKKTNNLKTNIEKLRNTF